MTDPLIYACLEEVRMRMLDMRSDSGVVIIKTAIEEIQRLNKDYAYAVEEINRLNKELESKDLKIKNYRERLFENYEH